MTNPSLDIEALIENEWYAVRHSGEIPEVALHSALHHLCEDPAGPQLDLTAEQRRLLLEGTGQRYLEITVRDLLPENIATGSYRGIKRSLINWRRFLLFCRSHELDSSAHQAIVAAALTELLNSDLSPLSVAERGRMFNCTVEDLTSFMDLLELDPEGLAAELRTYCCTA